MYLLICYKTLKHVYLCGVDGVTGKKSSVISVTGKKENPQCWSIEDLKVKLLKE